METEIGRLPLSVFIVGFLVYIISHLLIGWFRNKLEVKKENEGLINDEEQYLKYTKIMFKWWPVACVVLIVAVLYFA